MSECKRCAASLSNPQGTLCPLCRESSDRIEELEAQVERLEFLEEVYPESVKKRVALQAQVAALEAGVKRLQKLAIDNQWIALKQEKT